MGERTAIAWTHATFNPWIGCTKVSPACDHCYAESGSARLGAQHGLKLWQGDRYFTGHEYWKQPHRWDRAAAKAGERRRVFCASFADVFEGRDDLDASRKSLWNVIEQTPNLDWLLLTKRPLHIRRMVPASWLTSPRANVWYGITAESQERLDERWTHLADVPGVVHFLSIEPQLEYVRLGHFRPEWVICGGESGSKARPFRREWAEALRDECRAAGLPFFMKQMGRRVHGDDAGFRCVARWILEGGGEWVPPLIGEFAHVRPDNAVGFVLYDGGHYKGGDWDEWPEHLRVREFPNRSRRAVGGRA